MRYPEYCYIDTAFGGPHKRNNVMRIADVTRPQVADSYVTYFRFTEDYKQHAASTGSVAGYRGKCYADWLYIDIDSEDLEAAHQDTIDLLLFLESELDLNLQNLEIFFSGAKGFHVALPASLFGWEPSENLPDIHRSIAKQLFHQFRHVDTAIYEVNRLFRMPNTEHGKTGLFKIKLEWEEVLRGSVEQIKAEAKFVRKFSRNGEANPELHRTLSEIYKTSANQRFVSTPAERTITRQTRITELMSERGEGSRNESCFTLAYELRKKGLSRDETQAIIDTWNMVYCKPALDTKEILHTIDSAFRHLIKSKSEKLDRLKLIDDMERDYIEFLRQLETRGFSFRSFIPKLDKHITPIMPGNVVVVNAGTGVGKTTFLQNVNFHTGIPTLYVNLETSTSVLFERFQQMSAQLTSDEVKRIYREGGNIETRRLKHIVTLDDCDVNVDEIIDYWQLAQEKCGHPIPFIGIDHMGLLRAKGRSDYERITYTANELIKLAKKTDTIVFALSQVSREEGGEGDRPLSVNAAKGSGAIENAASLMLGIYRPDKNKNPDELDFTRDDMVIQVLKQRNGAQGIDCRVKYDATTMRIYEEVPF